jgi:hypothetical protein
MKSFINLGLIIFLGLSSFVVILYFLALYEKISKPTFKNLSTDDFKSLGIAVFVILVLDYLIIERFLKSGDGNDRQQKL